MSKPTSAVKRKYNNKAYDRTTLTLKKGQLDFLKSIAKEHGYSMNSLIIDSITDFIWEKYAIDFNAYPKPEPSDETE